MAYDGLLILQAAVTKTATFNGAGLDLKNGTGPIRKLWARVLHSAAANASGSNTVTFSVDHSDDNSTFYPLASQIETPLTLSTTAQAGEIFIPITTNKRYVRLTVTVAGAGSTPTITYSCQIGLSRP